MGNQTLGRGKIYFSELKTDGITPKGYRWLGNCSALNLTITNQKLDHFTSYEGIRQKDQTVILETDASGSITTDEISTENMALYFFGEEGVIAQTSGTSQTYTIVDAQPGLQYQVGRTSILPTGVRSLTSVVVKVGMATKTITTDYLLDAELGLVTIVEGGGIAADDDVIVEYSRSAVSRSQVISGDQEIEGSLRFVSASPVGNKVDYYIPWCKLSPNGDFSMISGDNWVEMQLNMEILKFGDYARIYADGRPYTP